MIFTDTPDYFADNAKAPYILDLQRLLQFILGSMGVSMTQVAMDYTLRCYPAKDLPTTKAGRASCISECNEYRFASIAKVKPKAIVTLGETSLEAFTGKTGVKNHTEDPVRAWEGTVRKFVAHIWCGYSLAYVLVSPSAITKVFKTIWQAAEEAGLNPKLNPDEPVFHWPDINN